MACLTVDATMTLHELVERFVDEADSMYAAIRRYDDGTTYWYTWTVEDLRLAAEQWDAARVDAPLTEALNLHESGSEDAYDTATGTTA